MSFQPCLCACGACRVQDVTWRPIEMGGDALGKRLQLIQRPRVVSFVVGRGEVGHHCAELQAAVGQQRGGLGVFFRQDAQATHPSVELQMNGPVLHARLLGPGMRSLEVRPGDDFRLQPVAVHRAEGGGVGIEHQHPGLDACFPKPHAFFRIRHRQAVDPLGLEDASQHHGVGAVAQPLDHGDDTGRPGRFLKQPDVVHDGGHVDGQSGDVFCRGQRLFQPGHGIFRPELHQDVG